MAVFLQIPFRFTIAIPIHRSLHTRPAPKIPKKSPIGLAGPLLWDFLPTFLYRRVKEGRRKGEQMRKGK